MTDRKIDLKNPWVAGLLAWLVPGAGHFYQQRNFKGTLYLVCIFGTFLFGMHLGEWRALYWTEPRGSVLEGRVSRRTRNYSFLLQMGTGGPGLWAYVQSKRFYGTGNPPSQFNVTEFQPLLERERRSLETLSPENRQAVLRDKPLSSPLEAEFRGAFHTADGQREVPLRGQLHLEPFNREFRGTFQGVVVTADGDERDLSLTLGRALYLERPVLGDPRRRVLVGVLDDETNEVQGDLVGTIPRSFFNWFAAPLNSEVKADLHLRLNKRFELALVFTWIAGLLNVLAVWDAVHGPAYGFGDEPPPEGDTAQNTTDDGQQGDSSETGSAADSTADDDDEQGHPSAAEDSSKSAVSQEAAASPTGQQTASAGTTTTASPRENS